MKILSVGAIPPEWGGRSAGGVATYHETLFKTFREGARGNINAIIPTNAVEISPAAPPEVYPAPDGTEAQKEFYLQLAKKSDVVLFNHIHHRWVRYHASIGRPRPSVGVVHSWHAITFAKDGDLAQAHRDRTQQGLKATDALVFPSFHTLEEGKSLGFTWDCPTCVIPNPLAPEFTSRPIDSSNERHQVLFVGALIPRKRPIQLLEAVAAIPGLPITFIGEGALDAELKQLAFDWGIAHRVRHLGTAPPAVVREELSRSAVMCVPSSSESFGLVYIEALACGTPVVGLKSVFDEIQIAMDVPCGVGIANGDPHTIRDALERVLNSSWNRDQLRLRALDQFSPHGTARMLLDCLEAVCRSW